MNLDSRLKRLESASDELTDCQTCATRPVTTIVKEPGDEDAPDDTLEPTPDVCPECKRTIEVMNFTINIGNTAEAEA